MLSGAAERLAEVVYGKLNTKTRTVKLGYAQRCAAHYASATDAAEAVACGEAAVRAAVEGKSGFMVKIVRLQSDSIQVDHRIAAVVGHRQRGTLRAARLDQRGRFHAQRKIHRIRPPVDRRRSESADRGRPAEIRDAGKSPRRETAPAAGVVSKSPPPPVHSTLDIAGRVRFTARDFSMSMNREHLTKAKSLGFSDRQIAHLTGQTEDAVRALRKKLGLDAELPSGGHLRRGIRGLHALLLFHLRLRRRRNQAPATNAR